MDWEMPFRWRPRLVSKSALKNSELGRKMLSVHHSERKQTRDTKGGCQGLGKLGDPVTWAQVHSWDVAGTDRWLGCDLINDLGPVTQVSHSLSAEDRVKWGLNSEVTKPPAECGKDHALFHFAYEFFRTGSTTCARCHVPLSALRFLLRVF